MARGLKLSLKQALAPLLLLFFCPASFSLPNYYNFDSSADLKESLFIILDSYHQPRHQDVDTLLPICDEASCFRHTSVGYKKAREYLFGFLFLDGSSPSSYSITTSYCQVVISNDNVSASDPLAPMNIPDHTVINAEHTWPQSLFSKKFSKDTQKSDLHILLPELSSINSQRGNHPFGVVTSAANSRCAGAALGKSASGRTVFEPRNEVKGDVARALFYFSVRYKMPIDPEQESTLRQWHQLDPVTPQEEWHNEQVFLIQKNRNPFVDSPEWVLQIKDF